MANAAAVLNTTELVEGILNQADQHTIVCAQRVNRFFKNTIDGSLSLKRKLWLEPDVSLTASPGCVLINPLLFNKRESTVAIKQLIAEKNHTIPLLPHPSRLSPRPAVAKPSAEAKEIFNQYMVKWYREHFPGKQLSGPFEHKVTTALGAYVRSNQDDSRGSEYWKTTLPPEFGVVATKKVEKEPERVASELPENKFELRSNEIPIKDIKIVFATIPELYKIIAGSWKDMILFQPNPWPKGGLRRLTLRYQSRQLLSSLGQLAGAQAIVREKAVDGETWASAPKVWELAYMLVAKQNDVLRVAGQWVSVAAGLPVPA